MAAAETSVASAGPRTAVIPPAPGSIEDTGLSAEAIADLAVKTLYVQGARRGATLVDRLALPFHILDEVLLDLQGRHLLEVRGTEGHGRAGYRFALTGAGRERAREAMDTSQYVGPAPVPMDAYTGWVERQAVGTVRIPEETIRAELDHLVLPEGFLDELGPAINSAKSMFLYGHSGNGKTDIAESIARMLSGMIYVPHAVDVEGQIVVVRDPVYHRPVEEREPLPEEGGVRRFPAHDARFVRVSRPVVFAGGELSLAELDLQYDHQAKFYQAPFQMKSNGGVLIIDDLGRQQVRPRDLLNRWIVPLEKKIDYLSLHTGRKFPVPFDCLVVFATNLAPKDLVDEAFLRRIHYKIEVTSPTYEQYANIFRRCCEERGVRYDEEAVRYVFQRWYERLDIVPRSVHPRDIVDHVCDLAKYRNRKASLAEDLLERACRTYFIEETEPDPSMALPGGDA